MIGAVWTQEEGLPQHGGGAWAERCGGAPRRPLHALLTAWQGEEPSGRFDDAEEEGDDDDDDSVDISKYDLDAVAPAKEVAFEQRCQSTVTVLGAPFP